MELPLEYVPNQQFEAWSRDPKTESEVLGPMPGAATAGSEPAGKIRAPRPAALRGRPLRSAAVDPRTGGPPLPQAELLEVQDRRTPRKAQSCAAAARLMTRIEKLCQETVVTRNQIICANLRLVVSIAKRRLGPAQNFFELVSDGNVSLMRAVERFDYSLGNSFSTYATWAIINNFARTIPEGLRHHARFRTDFCQLFTATADVRDQPPWLEAAQHGREIALHGILRRLNDREREIIVCRFGLRRGDEPKTLQQIGDVMGVSKERIRQIEARAMSKLRQAAVPEMLSEAVKEAVS